MPLEFNTPEGSFSFDPQRLVIAGWTGRDSAAVHHHIEELAAIGVTPPSTVPLYYEVSPALATQADTITVLGDETSGEVEPLLLRHAGRLYLGIGSDHTDRGLEAHSVAHSKQICPKVIGRDLWPLEAVADRLDTLRLHCRTEAGLYQDGTLAAIRPLGDLLASAALEDGALMLCGTLAAIGGVRPAERYDMALEGPGGDAIALSYTVQTLSVVA